MATMSYSMPTSVQTMRLLNGASAESPAPGTADFYRRHRRAFVAADAHNRFKKRVLQLLPGVEQLAVSRKAAAGQSSTQQSSANLRSSNAAFGSGIALHRRANTVVPEEYAHHASVDDDADDDTDVDADACHSSDLQILQKVMASRRNSAAVDPYGNYR
jgi:hypothetical protein